MKTSRGFTLVELVISMFAFVFVGIGICGLGIGGAVIMGNQWFTEDGVLRKIRLDHPEATRIVDTERNVFRSSVITVEQNGGGRRTHCLDSNVLFNYTITACDK